VKHAESKLQIACVQWFRLSYPQYKRLLFHVPNGGYRSKVTAAIMKREGVVSGVADLLLLAPNGKYNGLCIEMKTPKGRQSELQKLWENAVVEENYKYEIVRNIEQFMEVINQYMYDKRQSQITK
jgi:hypothetical protein